jgi:hypothetical protein
MVKFYEKMLALWTLKTLNLNPKANKILLKVKFPPTMETLPKI